MSYQMLDYTIPCFILIDDNLGDLHLLEVALKQLFPEAIIHSYESGEAFIEAWEDGNLRALNIYSFFIDYNMPSMSGRDVLKYLNENTSLSCPKYIFSGALLPVLKVEMLELGAADFLEKPFDFDALIALVEMLFKHDLPAA
ncbi:MAG: response regulator [Bacteroidota bacterium]